jgi:GNAT superfamily N-acetyltransferase
MSATPFDECTISLPEGRRARIRMLRPGELHLVRELCARLSLRTRYLRFFSPLPALPESLLQSLSEVDDHRRLAMIATLNEVDGGDVVALGNVVGLDDDQAEVGLVVADAWQRQGIGGALATTLLRAAAVCGFRRFVVHGLWDNPGLRPVLNRTADVVSARTRYGVSEISFVRRGSGVASSTALRSGVELEAGSSHPALERAYQRILLAGGRGES